MQCRLEVDPADKVTSDKSLQPLVQPTIGRTTRTGRQLTWSTVFNHIAIACRRTTITAATCDTHCGATLGHTPTTTKTLRASRGALSFNECTDSEHAFIELWEFTATEHTTQ